MEAGQTKTAERKPLNKELIICPLTFKATGGNSAVNYDISESKIKLPSGETIPGWRSAPQQRGHTAAFQAELQKLKEAGAVPQDWNAYYFTQEQGEKAAMAYMERVLAGKTKANKRSWGPTGEQGDKDKSRFHKLVPLELAKKYEFQLPVTIERLQLRYPELYGTKQERATSENAQPEATMTTEVALDLDNIEEKPAPQPTGQTKDVGTMSDKQVLEEIQGGPVEHIEEEEHEPSADEMEHAREEVAVAASTTLEDEAIGGIDLDLTEIQEVDEALEAPQEKRKEDTVQVESVDGIQTVTLALSSDNPAQILQSDSITWKSASGKMETRYLVMIEELDREEWLAEGVTNIDGTEVELKIDRS